MLAEAAIELSPVRATYCSRSPASWPSVTSARRCTWNGWRSPPSSAPRAGERPPRGASGGRSRLRGW